MASLKDPQRMTDDLRVRADELHAQVVDGEADLASIVRLADELGSAADRVATTFDQVNRALEQGEESAPPAREPLSDALAPRSAEEPEDVYERARESDIEIPSQPETSRDAVP